MLSVHPMNRAIVDAGRTVVHILICTDIHPVGCHNMHVAHQHSHLVYMAWASLHIHLATKGDISQHCQIQSKLEAVSFKLVTTI